MGYIYWIVLTFIFSMFEIFIPALITVWFAISSALTVIVSFIFDNLEIEVSFFVAVSIVLLVFTRPYAKKYFSKNKENYDSSLVGMEVVIIEKNGERTSKEKLYTVKFKGTNWSALSEDEFELNEVAYIEKFIGNKIIIRK